MNTTKMARTTKPLTNTEVKQAKPKDKVYSLSDGGGLQLRIKPTGSKLWLLDYYRPFTKKRTSLSLGAYPDVSLANARLGRDKARALLSTKYETPTVTTGSFTKSAIEEANRDGAAPIDLVDGDQLADKLKELALGVKTELVEKVTVDPEWFLGL